MLHVQKCLTKGHTVNDAYIKKTQPINRSGSVRSTWERATTNQCTAMFLIYSTRKQNCFCYG